MMSNDKTCLLQRTHKRYRCGMALVLTLIVLTVLATIAYVISSKIATVKHRRQYMIDYQNARYACDSGIKFALAKVPLLKMSLANRENEPDFSDVFVMDKSQYQRYLEEWVEIKLLQMEEDPEMMESDSKSMATLNSALAGLLGPETEDPNSPFSGMDDMFATPGMDFMQSFDPNELEIPGPYGPEWPLVAEPFDFDIGDARVYIEIEDENAKMPLTWALTNDNEVIRAANDAMQHFCEWMRMDTFEITDFQNRLAEVAQEKTFTINPKPITITKKVPVTSRTTTTTSRSSRLRRTSGTTSRSRASTTTVRKTRPQAANFSDFARLLHSSVIDQEGLARALPDTGNRYESPLKYLALWGSQRVNINTAPRHVLEAAFTFGGNYVEIADEIIKRRQEKPFKTIDELKDEYYGLTTAIEKAEPYITTTSNFFSIKVTAVSGAARASSVVSIIKSGKEVERIAVIASR